MVVANLLDKYIVTICLIIYFLKKVLVLFRKICIVKTMKHTTKIKANFSYETAFNNETKQMYITLKKEEVDMTITLNWWEAMLLLEKLKLEFCEK